jgi:hypothetical protein
LKPRARLVAVFILLQTILFLPALQTPVFAKGETFPAGHWSYDIIENLVVRGHLSELYDAAKPYTRYDVAKAIYNSDKSRIKDITTLWLFIKLEEELANELSWVEQSSMPGTALRLGVRLSEIAQKDAETSFSPKFRGRSRMALFYGEHFILYNSTVIQQQGAYDIVSRTRPFGKTTGYTEQAYVGFEKDDLKIKLGRDYLDWGYGRNSLVVNNEAGSFDQVFIQLQSNTVRFTYTTAILDQVVFNQEDKEGIGIISDHFDRYFTAERLDFNLLNSMLRFGIWQAVIYGGKNQPLNLRYANPFTIYKSDAKSQEENTNAIFGTDLSLYVGEGLNVYGSLMFNDWSEFSEDSAKVDLNKWGGILGFRASDILKSFDIYGTDAFVELNKLSLGAYDHPGAFKEYRYLFADNPIGHPNGSDFEQLELGLSHWFYRSLRVNMNLKMLSLGEASITNRSTALSDTDSPSGTPQKTTMLQLGAFYQPFNEFNSELSFANVWTSNAGNVQGRSETDFQVFLRVMIELQPFFQL